MSMLDLLNSPAPAEAELNQQLEEFMEEKCLTGAAREKMRLLPNGNKWKTVCMDRFASMQMMAAGGPTINNTPEYWTALLKGERRKEGNMEKRE